MGRTTVELSPSADFQTLFESAPDSYLVLNPDLTIVAVSDSYLRATMTKREEIVGRSLFDVFPDNPSDSDATGVGNLKASINRVLQDRVPDAMAVQKYDIRRPESEGGQFEERYWSPINSPVLGGNGHIHYIIHRVEDVTDFIHLKRQRTEQIKLAEEQRNRADRMESEIYLRAQELQEVNKQLRLAQAELELRVQERTAALEAVVDELNREIEERKRAVAAVAASEKTYRLLFAANPHPMWVYDIETLAFLAVNDAAVAHYGYSREEFLGMTILDIRPADEAAVVRDAVLALTPDAASIVYRKHRKKDGRLIDVEGTSRELLIGGRRARLVLAIDITERRILEDQFRQSQKMEAVGRLAGGVAHDFNNVLTAIIGYADLVLDEFGSNEMLRREVEEIKSAGQRAAALTHQLLTFSRRQILQPRVLNLNESIRNIEKMLRRLIREDIDIGIITNEDLGLIKADAGQIEQILMNLVVNAGDAMPNGGKLTIETANVELDQEYTRTHSEVTPGRYVLLAVSDTGIGMDAETMSHIFEPFFTTKAAGKGTGLGLSTVYGIVKQSGGHVWVYSEPGRGASFKVYLPRVDEVAEPAAAGAESAASVHGSESIMLVEDDEAVRKFARTVLEMNGYTVFEASRGDEAVEAFGLRAKEIDLVITDVIMPQMSGAQLVDHLRAKHPDVKVLYVSGYTEESTIHHGILDRGVEFLQKPFTAKGLALKVRESLDAENKRKQK